MVLPNLIRSKREAPAPSDNEISPHLSSDTEKGSVEIDVNSIPVSTKNSEVNDLQRALTTRQISMIAIAGVIGTGLFLGTGKSLASAGPASMLICYTIIGIIVYLTMLTLGEMTVYMPVAGSFGVYSGRFIDPAIGFAIFWNYWFNDAVSTASDLTALQLVMAYWEIHVPTWSIAFIFWWFLLAINIISVKAYGEVEYWLAVLKVVAIVIFIILGIVVNAGANVDHKYLGFHYWYIDQAPFVNGFKGFASVFVTASFAYGGTESIGITAGETKNPSRTMPRVVRTVFYRIAIFYLLTVLLIGINVPWNYPKLSTKSSATSPFTIVFQMAGSKGAGSFINAVIVTSVISAGNHALFAGSRLLFSLGKQGMAPRFVSKTSRNGVPWIALLSTWIIAGLCFGSSFIGAGELWSWLQNLVGVSNQISWLFIGIAGVRFRRAIEKQGKLHLLKYRNWTHPYGPWISIVASTVIILVQGWESFAPWNVSSFFSYYIELFVLPVMVVAWKLIKRTKWQKLDTMDLDTDVYVDTVHDKEENEFYDNLHGWRRVVYVLKSFFV